MFKALADSGRRRLLDALFARDGQTLGELCDVLPAITRFGVMKHLAVLDAAGLVVTEKVGRAKLHYLNPVPIREIQQRWISKYAEPTVAAMIGLRQQLETPMNAARHGAGAPPVPNPVFTPQRRDRPRAINGEEPS